MGFGGFLGKLVEVAADVVTLPVSVAKDLFTMGGVVIDEPPATIEKFDELRHGNRLSTLRQADIRPAFYPDQTNLPPSKG